MTLHYFLLKGHSIDEFRHISTAEFLFLQAVMEADIEMHEEIAESISK